MSINYKNDENGPNVELLNIEWQQVRDIDYLFASRLVKDARDLRNLTFKKTERDLKSYELFLQKKLTYVLYLVILVHLLLPLVEEPAINGLELPYWINCCIEIFCLFIYLLRILHLHSFQTREAFNGDKKNFGILIIATLILIDIIQFMIVKSLNVNFAHRYTRFLRVFIIINFNEGKELRRAFRNVRKTLPDILHVFALFFISLMLFSFIAWRLFKDKELNYLKGQIEFKNLEDSVWNLYIAVTTANFPDVMMPAYDYNGAYAIFFLIFMLINLYLFINIILATIYTNYKKHLKEEVRSTLILKRKKIRDAFDLLKQPINEINNQNQSQTESITNSSERVLTYESFVRLIKLSDSTKSENQIKILFQVLDLDNNGTLSFKEFLYLPDLLNIRISEIKDRMNLFEKLLPSIYNHKLSVILINFVKHWIFRIIFDFLILLNIIFIVIDIQTTGRIVEWIFLMLFLFEILLKVYAFGIRIFISSYWNIFDSIVILGGFIAGIIDQSNSANYGIIQKQSQLFDIVLVLRSLRLVKFVASIKRFRVIITTIGIIIPSLLTYGMLLLTIFYIFSMIGMEIFGKIITSQVYNDSLNSYDCNTNGKLNDTDFAKFRYCSNNFADFPSSLILLFELMVVNQWHVLSKGFEDALDKNKFTRLYFFAFHISCVIILLNIFTAFVIEAFLLEYDNQDDSQLFLSKLEQRIINLELDYDETNQDEFLSFTTYKNKKSKFKQLIDSIKDIAVTQSKTFINNNKQQIVKFHINSKEPKAVEILLQRMFNNELDITDDDNMNQ